ncbi:MAG TPA: hypothetical protein VHZ99_14165 [Steroidobacteraceae bacterium]|jgi:hypothetical protein|nr:hypothetical protein [Steroidobacteraceae bacterium]
MRLRLNGASARAVWQRIRCFSSVLGIIRFSVLIPVVLILTLIGSDQMSDALIALADTGSALRQMALFVMALLAALTVWYTAHTMYRFHFAHSEASRSQVHPRLKCSLPRVLAVSVPLALLIKVWSLRSGVADPVAVDRVAGGLAIVLGITALIVRLGQPDEARDLSELRFLPRTTRLLLVGLLLGNILAVLLALNMPLFELGAPALLLLALALITFTGSVLVYAANHERIPVLSVLVLWVIFCSFFGDNHEVRQQPGDGSVGAFGRRAPRDVTTLQPSALAGYSVASYFDAWYDDLVRQEPGTDPIPVVLVAADGGGIRAAYWTASILGRLQDLTACHAVPFARHVFAISGVSGGSLGAATFSAIAAGRIQHPRDCHTDSWTREANTMLGRDFLSPTLANALFIDLPQRLIPFPLFDDRAIALEKSWEHSWRWADDQSPGLFAAPFQNLWSQRPFDVPLLYLNGTVVETGERSLVQPLAADPQVRDLTFANTLQIGSVFGTQLPLSSAVLLSARFTYVSPAGTLGWIEQGRERWRRLVDGGYFDNSGTITLREILHTLRAERHRVGTPGNLRPPQLIVIHIGNDPKQQRVAEKESSWQRFAAGRHWLSETLAPMISLLNVREGHGRQSTQIMQYTSDDDQIPYFDVELWRGATSLPLGWSLSTEARGEMDRQLLSCSGYDPLCGANIVEEIRKLMTP